MDFTLSVYRRLLEKFISANYSFVPFKDYISSNTNKDKIVILRHDVDRCPQNSLDTAVLENSLGITGTYYFRIVPESFDKEILQKISNLGHEIGYHYEDVDLANKQFKFQNPKTELSTDKLKDLSYESFCNNLETIRKFADVKTICMHGSPLSKFDNKIIWKKYDYRKLGILGEPYLDLDWQKLCYLTDTGRKWNGDDVSVRDKVKSSNNSDYKTTFDIINNLDKLSSQIMITVHPQRWNDDFTKWSKELVMQNIKNVIKKYFLVKK